jgi:hypothetical protein
MPFGDIRTDNPSERASGRRLNDLDLVTTGIDGSITKISTGK